MIFLERDLYKNKIGIYKITNLKNKKVYIGQTKECFERRYFHHRWCLTHNQHHSKLLQNDWNIYGSEEFVFEVIETIDDVSLLDPYEQKYIKQYNATDNHFGYNLQVGGDASKILHQFVSDKVRKYVGSLNRIRMTGSHLSEETKERMRHSSPHRKLSMNEKQNISNRMRQHVVGFETREKLRQANMGSKSPVTHLTENDVAQIKQRIMHKEKRKDIAADYQISVWTLDAISSGKTWKHVIVDGWSDYLNQRHK